MLLLAQSRPASPSVSQVSWRDIYNFQTVMNITFLACRPGLRPGPAEIQPGRGLSGQVRHQEILHSVANFRTVIHNSPESPESPKSTDNKASFFIRVFGTLIPDFGSFWLFLLLYGIPAFDLGTRASYVTREAI